jgi:hypothetical protein
LITKADGGRNIRERKREYVAVSSGNEEKKVIETEE